jgi:hypothetical protein
MLRGDERILASRAMVSSDDAAPLARAHSGKVTLHAGDVGSTVGLKGFSLGHNCWWHIAAYYDEHNYLQNPDNEWAGLTPEANMFCAPRNLNMTVGGANPVLSPTGTWVQAVARARQHST